MTGRRVGINTSELDRVAATLRAEGIWVPSGLDLLIEVRVVCAEMVELDNQRHGQ